jgi:predicted membrane-bound dolichyl-phosphate-mannose-protein mannosyltransferase
MCFDLTVRRYKTVLNKTRTFFYFYFSNVTVHRRHGLEIMGQLSYRFYDAHLIPPEPAAVAQTRAALAQKKSLTFVKEIYLNQKNYTI